MSNEKHECIEVEIKENFDAVAKLAQLMDAETGIPWALREIERMADFAEVAEMQAANVKHYAEAQGHKNRSRAFQIAASLIRQAAKLPREI
jgi:hypothetical protein